MSDLQGRRIPGEEGSGRRGRWLWIVLGLLLLDLLALLIPFACQNLTGGSGGSDAQGGAQQEGDGQGGDQRAEGDSGNADDGAAGSEGPREVTTARLSTRDQSGDGEAVTVPSATVEGARGWLAVRADDGGEPREVLGYAPLGAGENSEVEVGLRRPLESSQELYATVHAESPADGNFTYPEGDPTAENGGQAAVEPLSYTLDVAPDGGGGDELPASGGVSPIATLALGNAALLAGVVALLLVSRRGRAPIRGRYP